MAGGLLGIRIHSHSWPPRQGEARHRPSDPPGLRGPRGHHEEGRLDGQEPLCRLISWIMCQVSELQSCLATFVNDNIQVQKSLSRTITLSLLTRFHIRIRYRLTSRSLQRISCPCQRLIDSKEERDNVTRSSPIVACNNVDMRGGNEVTFAV